VGSGGEVRERQRSGRERERERERGEERREERGGASNGREKVERERVGTVWEC